MDTNPHSPAPDPWRHRPAAAPKANPPPSGGIPLRWIAVSLLLGGLAGIRLAPRSHDGFRPLPPTRRPAPKTEPPAPHASQPQGHPRPGAQGYERRDVSVAWIFGIVLFLGVSGVIIHLAMAGFLSHLKKGPMTTDAWQPIPHAAPSPPAQPPAPRLQVSPPADLAAFRDQEAAELNSYGWINHTAGVVRIPIRQAMDLLLQRGLPVREGNTGGQPGPSSYELMHQRPQHREPEIQGSK